ncbi:antitoxin [Calidifontibacter sp. DB0510]|uniref:Antitoxin n=1 Tax=Metallococcus carri TaxID=1656884 RepID=A0A967EA07_9MICO|nr:antitoxin [Metallococcus carri]NHN56957.1 antitoxin [Metallococcus carri]NOP37702.1 antitoxin [Calidifontibacter sp. DB2511S]
MSNSDKAKDIITQAKQAALDGVAKAKKAAQENPDKVRAGIDRVGGTVNQVTKGKYADKIAKASNKAEEAIQKQAKKPTPGGSYGGPTGPTNPNDPTVHSTGLPGDGTRTANLRDPQ